MIESLHIAATGMQSQQQMVEMISNNIANLNTLGFKKSAIQFVDLLQSQSAASPRGSHSSNKTQGVAVLESAPVFSQGDFKQTGNVLDIAIDGAGFFELVTAEGDLLYTRNGAFQIDSDGYIVNAEGAFLGNMIQVPNSAEQVFFSENGDIYVTASEREEPQLIGSIELAQFMNPKGLNAIGGGQYQPTLASGDAQYVDVEEAGANFLQGYLEASNVEMVQELTNLMLAQRAYGLNSRIIQVSDELMGIVNGLRR